MMLLRNLLAAPAVPALDLALKQWLEEQEQRLRQGYELYRQYYRGDHRSQLTDRLKKFLPPSLEFRDNFLDVVVDVQAERLNVIGFDAGGQAVTALGGLGLPAWEEKSGDGRTSTKLRILSQDTVSAGSRYLLRWIALGA